MKAPVLYIVIPCYNEEEALPFTSAKLTGLLDDMTARQIIDPASRVLMVDDGSRDGTWQVICGLHEKDARFQGAKLAHNAGHMNALWAGMTLAEEKCDCVITIDVNAMYGFLEEFRNGADVVSGVRSSRAKDTFFKRATAQGFYKMMNRLGVEMVYNHADYRLLSKRALHSLLSFGEVNMFLRGMVPMLGYKTAIVKYERGERVAGESKYPLKKMIAFAIQGITSFSTKPLSFVTGAGLLSILVAIGMFVYVLVSLGFGHAIAGWGSMMISIWLIGGLIMLSLGIVGEYVGKIYMESKHRPRYRIETTL